MKILITGNMGYVGPVLVRHLRTTYPQATLIGYDRGFFSHCLTAPGPIPEVAVDEQYFGDVREMPGELLSGVDTIVHLAAVSNDPMGNKYAAATDSINFQSSVRLGQLAAAAKVKTFVFASSCSVYGAAEEGHARKEGDPLSPLTAYARSKIETETALRKVEIGDMRVRCLRFATACGMSPRLRLDLVLNDFVASAVATGRIVILSDGSPWRPLIDVSDMALAIDWAATSSDHAEQFLVVNAGSDACNVQVRDLAKSVAAIVTGATVSINDNAQPDKRSYKVDFGLYKSLAPRHQPRMTLNKSIEAVRDGLKIIAFADSNFRNSQLMRLRVLDGLVDSGAVDNNLRSSRQR